VTTMFGAEHMSRGSAVGLGLLAGGVLGAVTRPAVVYFFCLRSADVEFSFYIMCVSAAIGLVVGLAAVGIAAVGRGLPSLMLGAICGGMIAYGFTMLTFLPLFWGGLLGVSGLRFDEDPVIYGIAMGLTGVFAGACGALLQDRLREPPVDAQ
jgi:hypothetical protein